MSVAAYFKAMVQEAFVAQASDIHLEPRAKQGTLRFRVDGLLHTIKTLDNSLFLSLIAHIKVLADLNVSEKSSPQDGRLELSLGAQNLELRVSTLPTQVGECVTLRLLDKKDFSWKLTDVGLPETILNAVTGLTRLASGLVVVSGPTGSGKTTTIYSLLTYFKQKEDQKILSLEDPVEYSIDGIQQVSIQPELGLCFSSGLRSFLRQDPNIIFVGEIRDAETAKIAIHAALTGHLVFTTLHTQDSIRVIHRLMHLGIEPFLISASLRGVLAQRLVRRLCNCCKTLSPQSQEGLRFTLPTYEARGCPTCKQSGFQGRFPLFEWLSMDARLKGLIHTKSSYSSFKEALEGTGFSSLEAEAKAALKEGKTSLSEVRKFFQV